MEMCPICASEISPKNRLAYNNFGLNNWGLFSDLHIKYCGSCGFGFSFPELDRDAVNNFYEKRYRAKDSAFHIDFNKLKNKENRGVGDIRNSRAFGQISLGRSFCEFNQKAIFLDIGPGKGGSFKVASALFNEPTLRAIELSDGAREYYKNIYNARSLGSLADFRSLSESAKMILMSHSLEHYRLADLSDLLGSLLESLSTDGIAVIEVPHVDLRVHADYRGVDTPHFLFFSKESLAKLFSQNGFEVVFIDTCGPEYQGSVKQQDLFQRPSKLKQLLLPSYVRIPAGVQSVLRSSMRFLASVNPYTWVRRTSSYKKLPYLSYGGNRNSIRMVVRRALATV